ncbi:uncharacterized protein FFB20_15943 [Fusarium fujikuroi]|nr:uncharacterized protein FFB20_15943 [Fusarium fujikuroi]
MHLLVTRDLL